MRLFASGKARGAYKRKLVDHGAPRVSRIYIYIYIFTYIYMYVCMYRHLDKNTLAKCELPLLDSHRYLLKGQRPRSSACFLPRGSGKLSATAEWSLLHGQVEKSHINIASFACGRGGLTFYLGVWETHLDLGSAFIRLLTCLNRGGVDKGVGWVQ